MMRRLGKIFLQAMEGSCWEEGSEIVGQRVSRLKDACIVGALKSAYKTAEEILAVERGRTFL